jgi:hypothetical protein
VASLKTLDPDWQISRATRYSYVTIVVRKPKFVLELSIILGLRARPALGYVSSERSLRNFSLSLVRRKKKARI